MSLSLVLVALRMSARRDNPSDEVCCESKATMIFGFPVKADISFSSRDSAKLNISKSKKLRPLTYVKFAPKLDH